MPSVVTSLRTFLRGSWLQKGVWTILDQALFAGGNFLVNVLLARWLTPEAYGAFTVAFVVFLLAGTVHGGLLIEPMLVFGPGRFEGRTSAYLRVLIRAHGIYSLGVGALLAVAGAVAWAVDGPTFGRLFLVLAVAQGAILVLWLLRRACFVVSRPDWAAGAGALYLVLLAGSGVGLYLLDSLTGPAALLLMGGTSLLASGILARRLGVFGAGPVEGLAAEAREAHVEYGRWAAATGLLEWLQLAVPFLALPLFVGLSGSGTLRALFNLAMPAIQGFGALATLCLPIFVRARAAGRFGPTVRTVGGGFVALAVTYGALVLALGYPVVEWLYDGKYHATSGALVCLALLPLTVAVSNVFASTVRSDERPSAVFRARAIALTVSSTVTIALAAWYGVVGALAGSLIVSITEAVALALSARTAPPAATAGRALGEAAPGAVAGDGAPVASPPALGDGPDVGRQPEESWT